MKIKETGILMTAPLREAVKRGDKTQTRRVIVPQPERGVEFVKMLDAKSCAYFETSSETMALGEAGFMYHAHAPWGKPGDLLYIKEPHYLYGEWLRDGKTKTGRDSWRFDCLAPLSVVFPEEAHEWDIVRGKNKKGWFKRSPLFMAKRHARTWLELTDVRVEPVQDISHEDAIAEGCCGVDWENHPTFGICTDSGELPQEEFEALWDSINAPRYPWKNNDWVWAYTFTEVEK